MHRRYRAKLSFLHIEDPLGMWFVNWERKYNEYLKVKLLHKVQQNNI
jgi:hypothetical protein